VEPTLTVLSPEMNLPHLKGSDPCHIDPFHITPLTPVIREPIDPGGGHAHGLLGVLGALKFT